MTNETKLDKYFDSEIPQYEKYFSEKNIDVVLNALGNKESLVRSYIYETQDHVDGSNDKKSHFVKNECYNLYYDIKPRKKYTGFEQVKKLDNELRIKLSGLVTTGQMNLGAVLDKNLDPDITYKEVFALEYNNGKEKLLYYSGGIDSELAALLLLESGIKFTPVIFTYIDNNGNKLNEFDISYAYDFCSKHNLKPIEKTLNLEKLWNSEEFIELAKNVGFTSPQLVTYAHMVELMAKQYPKHQHLFGGEVRYKSDYLKDNGELANLVQLAKVNPGYNGFVYEVILLGTGTLTIRLFYNAIAGTWGFTSSLGSVVTSGGPTSGTWTTTPATSYEYRITSVVVTLNDFNDGAFFPTPPVPPETPWTTMTGSNFTICTTSTTLYTMGSRAAEAYYTIEVRKVGTTSPVQTSTIALNATLELS